MIALIPARAGSKRIPGKNTKLLAGRPLIDYTIRAAIEADCFTRIYICTDDPKLLHRKALGSEQLLMREESGPKETDYHWIMSGRVFHHLTDGAFCILRPTSPFRGADAIKRAVNVWRNEGPKWDSLRAIRPVSEHPGKMWVTRHGGTVPLMGLGHGNQAQPWHSMPTQELPQVYVQTAGLEIAWVITLEQTGTISGSRVRGMCLNRWEGFDINTPDDWIVAEHHAKKGDWPLG
jgi:CMP-N,N'-diacetyllegionaminic acid synthase